MKEEEPVDGKKSEDDGIEKENLAILEKIRKNQRQDHLNVRALFFLFDLVLTNTIHYQIADSLFFYSTTAATEDSNKEKHGQPFIKKFNFRQHCSQISSSNAVAFSVRTQPLCRGCKLNRF